MLSVVLKKLVTSRVGESGILMAVLKNRLSRQASEFSKNRLFYRFGISFILLLLLCSADAAGYRQIQWIDLLPEEELRALTEDPIPDSVIEGSAADRIKSALSMEIDDPVSDYEKALVSVRVRGEFNNSSIKLPGYIVPVEADAKGRAITFFFVPFFGACIHLPPPPPNQIIYAAYSKGIAIDDLEVPYWIEATLFTKQQSNDMATAAYSATVDTLYPFQEGDEY